MFFRGRKQQTLSMTLEGVLGPNGRLDEADAIPMAAPEAVCVNGAGELLASSGSERVSDSAMGQEARTLGKL